MTYTIVTEPLPVPAIKSSLWRDQSGIWHLGDYKVMFSGNASGWIVHFKNERINELLAYPNVKDAREAVEDLIEKSPTWQCIDRTWYLRNHAVAWDAAGDGWTIYHFQAALLNHTYLDPENAKREVERRVAAIVAGKPLPLPTINRWEFRDSSWQLGDYRLFSSTFYHGWVAEYNHELLTDPSKERSVMVYQNFDYAKREIEALMNKRQANDEPTLDAKEKELADLHRRDWHCDNAIWHKFDYEVRCHGNTGWAIYHKHLLLENHANYVTPSLAMKAADDIIAATTWRFDGRRWCKGDYTLRWCERPRAIVSGWYIYYNEASLAAGQPYKDPELAKLDVDKIIRKKATLVAKPAVTKPVTPNWRCENSIWKIGDYMVRWHDEWSNGHSQGKNGWYIWYQHEMLPPLEAYKDAATAKAAVEAISTQAYDNLLSTLKDVMLDTEKSEPKKPESMNQKFNNIWELIAKSVQTNRPIEYELGDGTWEICTDFSPQNLQPMLNTDWLKRIFTINKLRLQPTYTKKFCWIVMRCQGDSFYNASDTFKTHDLAADWLATYANTERIREFFVTKIIVDVPDDLDA